MTSNINPDDWVPYGHHWIRSRDDDAFVVVCQDQATRDYVLRCVQSHPDALTLLCLLYAAVAGGPFAGNWSHTLARTRLLLTSQLGRGMPLPDGVADMAVRYQGERKLTAAYPWYRRAWATIRHFWREFGI